MDPEREALRANLVALYPSLLSFARHLARNRFHLKTVDAQDLVQDSCLIAWQKAEKFGGKSSDQLLRALRWIILYRLFRGMRRSLSTKRRAERKYAGHPEWLDELPAQDPPLGHDIEVHEMRHQIFKALKTLPREESRLVVLVYLRGCSVRDAARILGLEEHSQVYKTLRRAFDHLRQKIRAERR